MATEWSSRWFWGHRKDLQRRRATQVNCMCFAHRWDILTIVRGRRYWIGSRMGLLSLARSCSATRAFRLFRKKWTRPCPKYLARGFGSHQWSTVFWQSFQSRSFGQRSSEFSTITILSQHGHLYNHLSWSFAKSGRPWCRTHRRGNPSLPVGPKHRNHLLQSHYHQR